MGNNKIYKIKLYQIIYIIIINYLRTSSFIIFKFEFSLIENVSNVSFLSAENSVIAIFETISSSLYPSLFLFLLLAESIVFSQYYQTFL